MCVNTASRTDKEKNDKISLRCKNSVLPLKLHMAWTGPSRTTFCTIMVDLLICTTILIRRLLSLKMDKRLLCGHLASNKEVCHSRARQTLNNRRNNLSKPSKSDRTQDIACLRRRQTLDNRDQDSDHHRHHMFGDSSDRKA